MGHSEAVLAAAFVPSLPETPLVSVGWDNRLCLWNFRSGVLIAERTVVPSSSSSSSSSSSDPNKFTGKGLPWQVVAAPDMPVVAILAKDYPYVALASVQLGGLGEVIHLGMSGAVPTSVTFAAGGVLLVSGVPQGSAPSSASGTAVLQVTQFRMDITATGNVTAVASVGADIPANIAAFNAYCERHKLVPESAIEDNEDGAIVKTRVDRRWSSQSLADKISKTRAAKKERYLEGQKEREEGREKKKKIHEAAIDGE